MICVEEKKEKPLGSKKNWAFDIGLGMLRSVIFGDSTRKPFWSYKHWYQQRNFFKEHGQPLDVFRNLEYNYAEWAMAAKPGHKVADIGTGHTVFAGYLAQKFQTSLLAIDYDRYCEGFQREFMSKLGHDDFDLLFTDATKTDLPDATFDRILAVSVIEHFPEDGDIRFVKEAARLLKPGGRLVITVPADHTYMESEQVTHYHGFERRYDEEALYQRLVAPSGLFLRNVYYMNQRPNSLAGRKLTKKYSSLDQFFGVWYEERNNMSYSDYSIFVTRTLLDVSNRPDNTVCGAMLSLEKEH